MVKVKGRDNTFKNMNVRKQKVHNALLWLMQNNPHYRDITINEHALQCLPVNGVPSGIMTVESDTDMSSEITSPDLGLTTQLTQNVVATSLDGCVLVRSNLTLWRRFQDVGSRT